MKLYVFIACILYKQEMGMLEFKSNTKDNYNRLILGWQKLNNNNLNA